MGNKLKILAVFALAIAFSCVLISIDVNADATNDTPISITEASYSDGILTLAGTTNGHVGSSLKYYVMGQGHTSPYSYVKLSDGRFSTTCPIGHLDDGDYQVVMFDSSGVHSVSRTFRVSNDVPIEVIFTMRENHSMYVDSRVSLNALATISPSSYVSNVVWTYSGNAIEVDGGFVHAINAGTSILTGTLTNGDTIIIRNCLVTVNSNQQQGQPTIENDYTFFIQVKMDADIACIGTSYSAKDLMTGFEISSKGEDAADALEKACMLNGIPVELGKRTGTEGWVVHMFNMSDELQPDGTWKYWVQHHNGSYNDWTLGHYKDGGYFSLMYAITAEIPQAKTGLYYNGNIQTGVAEGPGFTVTGGTAKDVGSYSAIATLTSKDYMWTDGTTAPKTIVWSISASGDPSGGGDTDPTPDQPTVPDAPNDHLDPTDPTVTVEKDSIQNADGTITNVQTLTKTEEDGKTTTTVITTTPQNDGTVEEIKSTSNSQTNEGGIKTESSLETVTIKDPNGGVKSETHIEVSVIDTTGSSGTGTKGVTITANDKGGNATVKAVYQEGSQSASVVTEVKISEENGQVVISHESLDVALKMQEMYSKKIVNENESVKDATKVIQVGSGSSDANVKLSSDIVKKIADADSAILVSGTAGSMEVSKTVMSNISEYDDIAISVAKAIEDVLTDEQRAAINNDATVVKVKVMSGDKSIGDKLNGEITISIKHVTAPGMVPVAYYVHDDGTMEKVDGKYNMKNNEMVVKTTHCSIYAVIDEAPESSDGNILLYTGIAIAAVIIIAAIATFMLRRR